MKTHPQSSKRNYVMSWMIGDDYLVHLNYKRKYASYFTKLFGDCGLPGNIDKQSDSPDHTEFLQRIGIHGYVDKVKKIVKMIYLLMSALRSAVFPENFVDPELFNSNMFCCKIAQIVENTVDHPAFVEFCKFIAKGQKDIIPFAKQAASKLDAIWKKAQSVRGIRESYNNEKMNRPLSSFECIKIWASM